MKKSKMQATTLRTIMTVIIVIVIILSALGFYYAQSQLNTFAVSVGQTVSESTAGSGSTQTTKKIQEDIAAVQAVADKSDGITTSSQDYQNQMIKDLNKYASNTGISITDYNFAPSTTPTTKTSSLTGGASTSSVTITLNNPILYTSLIKFLKSIETNLPKMQITGISITHDQNASNTVTVEPLTIQIYTR